MFHSVGRVRGKVAKDTVEQWLGHATEVATTRTVEQRRVAQRRVAQDRLGRAAARGLVREAQQALDDGADVNAAVFRGDGTVGGTCTAACVAASNGRCGVLGVLLAAPVSADPNKGCTYSGWTPCHAACATEQPDAVTLLLAHGADPNIADEDGWTACIWAAFRGSTACLRALAEGTARQVGRILDVNAVATGGYYEGRTALDYALNQPWCSEAAAYLRDVLGALRAEELPQPKRPKSAAKVARGWKATHRTVEEENE